MQTDYLTTTQTAKLFHVTRFTILNWVKQNKIQAVSTLGGHQRIPRKAVLDLLKKTHPADQAPVEAMSQPEATTHMESGVLPAGQSPLRIPRKLAASAAFLNAQRSKIGQIFQEGAFKSGKYIASIKHEFVKKQEKEK